MDLLNSYQAVVWPFIENFLSENLPSGFHQEITMDYPRRKGKYLRPSLVLITAGAMGFDPHRPAAIATAAAIQISEDWILNHDDIEDDSLERRGAPALHRRFGIPLAINAGDTLQALNWQLIYRLKNATIFDEFSRILNLTLLGQTIELKWIRDQNFNLNLKDVYRIIESKTCYYTIAGPMRLGAILAGATPQQLQILYKFGLYLGKSYQIIDDYLDLTSDFGGQKKQIGNDLYEGKRTVILVDLLRKDKDSKLLSILSKSREEKTKEEINFLLERIKKAGSLEFAYSLANKFANKAKKIFNQELTFLVHQPYRDQLAQVIDFVVNRRQ
ncbi:MAG TPA: polyprenyl synthetase family protein [Candidatus Woesebacteria bacterium]|nr:polyprenyl synthetase family protein [Candidatus Woesebacteria bacterium]HRS23061.1 polyprenyl synthetase family protein [Candidatus Woesebacteria bacterium]HRT39989.1 polyprenyl synthetase family protein [Candidatus Woesebacteria bacterium]